MVRHSTIRGKAFDPETIELMRGCLEDAWALLGPYEQSRAVKSDLAVRILNAASKGERDPVRLRTCALVRLATQPVELKKLA